MDIERLIQQYPVLFHMAEPGSWASIRRHGLLSTSTLLDHVGLHGARRAMWEAAHRPEKVRIRCEKLGEVVLRDQKPMNAARLNIALQDGMTPKEWYMMLNSRVFFWATRARLHTLLNARAYRDEHHDVLTLKSAHLIRDYADQILLCHMNSGNTFPMPHRRGRDTFRSIADYPVKRNGSAAKEVAEVTVLGGVPNIIEYVAQVDRMRGGTVLHNIFSQQI